MAGIILMSCITMDVNAGAGVKLKEKFKAGNSVYKASEDEYSQGESYQAVKQQYEEKGYKPSEGIMIAVSPEDMTSYSGESMPVYSDVEGKKKALLWDDEREYIEWTVNVPEDGLYEITADYYSIGDANKEIQRSLEIDGKVPFEEAYTLTFPRVWKDAGEPKVNNIGDEVKPKQIEVKKWQTISFIDSQGMYSEPFRFYFSSGIHKIRLNYLEEAIALGALMVKSPSEIPAYSQVTNEYEQKGYKNASKSKRFEAENTVTGKNDQTMSRGSDSNPATYPSSTTSVRLNMMGGWSWRKGGQSITWKFTVPENGLYKIGIRAAQYYGDGLPVYRQIAIDGKVPFSEMEEYKFKYNKNWQKASLEDEKGNPYLFYLESGEHEITMTVKAGQLREVAESVEKDTLTLSKIIRRIIMLTGTEPDVNYEYELDRNIPDLLENLTELSAHMKANEALLSKLSSKRSAMSNNFLMISDQLDEMVKKPETIPLKLNDLNNAMGNLSSWSLDLQDSAMAIDYFIVDGPECKWTIKNSNFFQMLASTWQNLITSFTRDYDNVGSVYTNQNKTNTVLNVWVSRGKEWAEVIKELSDEYFTPESGISINVNVVPAAQLDSGAVNSLLLSICSGKAPDVACSISASSPVEYAIRGSVVDLSKFSDFDNVKQRFLQKIMIPFEYKGGTYALPETMNFKALFYRKDIIDELGVDIPNTWEDVYQNLLPILYQNGLEFNYSQDFSTFLFQNGGKYYSDEGTKSGLDSSEAYRAFREYTELYTNYNIPISANFFNRMRQGEMPIGIGDYSLYVQLLVAAPELAKRWEIAPLPGHVTEDGKIDRSTGGIVSTGNIILSQSDKQKEAWEFLKWWARDDTQTKYGKILESLMGVQARWNTANTKAFTELPWNKHDLAVIKKQWEWANEMPVVLGGYFTGRHLDNAWNRVVLGEMNIRDSLEMSVKDINRELESKQQEFGFSRDTK